MMTPGQRRQKIRDGLDLLEKVFLDVLRQSRERRESWVPTEIVASWAELPNGTRGKETAEYILRRMENRGQIESRNGYLEWNPR
ncbi:MAG: hypothetical protein OXC95_06645 [Dehalococcoidia bacterium]|nr:hypothetical protein [Dehalococcoidia bacterium]